MIIYQSDKSGFLKDSATGQISQIITDHYHRKLGTLAGTAEQHGWKNSLVYMSNVLQDPDIPTDSGVAIEYMLPQTSNRIDFILTGQDDHSTDHALLVELKQWSIAELTDQSHIIMIDKYKAVPHPSYQAWSYAETLNNFNAAVEDGPIILKPCTYLHNYVLDDVIAHEMYADYINQAPLFLKGDADKLKLQRFIKQYMKKGDRNQILYRIDNGRIRPSKHLADCLTSMLQGNSEFVLLDQQKVVFEKVMSLAKKTQTTDDKYVCIIKGGPGTGKSVVAINLLVSLIEKHIHSRYVTKNAAPRKVYESKLKGTHTKTQIAKLFSGSGDYTKSHENDYDVLLIDEAHRLNEKSGMYKSIGENQIKELIHAARLSVFFLDEDQKVTWGDIGDREEILTWAHRAHAKVLEDELTSQFRCSGSDGYLAWLDHILQIRETANPTLDTRAYDFQVIDSPSILRDMIIEKNKAHNKARMVAGYCWEWRSREDPSIMDIRMRDYNFNARWNLTADGPLWIMSQDSVHEVGCIHTCQGLEVDYIGVIIGPDLIVRDGKILTDPSQRARSDKSLSGYKTALKADPTAAHLKADQIIKNTYRTLMTRGMKGCYVYCVDKETREYFRKLQ